MLRFCSFAFLLVVGVLLPASANATLMARISLETLVSEADHIAVVRAQDGAGAMEGGHIVTDTTLVVVENWKGEGERFVARTLGGEVGDYGSRVSGAAHFETGREYVVFLEARAGHLRVMGMSQGVMPVFGGSVFTGAHGVSFVPNAAPNGGDSATAGSSVEAGGEAPEQDQTFLQGTMPLTTLQSQVDALLEASR